MVKGTYHGSNKFIAPLAITIFLHRVPGESWIILPGCAARGRKLSAWNILRTVETETSTPPSAMALEVSLIQWVGVTHKGFGVSPEMVTAPFPAKHGLKILPRDQFAFRVIEEVSARCLLDADCRHMYAGELIFC